MQIVYKTDKMNNIISNKIKHFNKYGRKEVYWHAQTATNFTQRGQAEISTQDLKNKEKKIIHGEGTSKFSDHAVKEGHELKPIKEETMTIINLEKVHKNKNTRRDWIIKSLLLKFVQWLYKRHKWSSI